MTRNDDRPALWRTLFSMMISPGSVLRRHVGKYPWPLALLISALAFGLFFLQTGLDLERAGTQERVDTMVQGLLGVFIGTVGIALLAAAAWVLSRVGGGRHPVGWAVRAFALGYAPTLIYCVCGLACNRLLGWNTTVAFGVPGFLWALGPMFASIRELTSGKARLSVWIATVCGVVLLAVWTLVCGLVA